MKEVSCPNCALGAWVGDRDTACECAKCHILYSTNPVNIPRPNLKERDEVAKEIFKLLSVDLVKAAHFNEEISKNFQSIAEANCRAAFLHADLFMEQKSKCQNKSQSN